MANIQIELNKTLFLKNPQHTEIGKKIIQRGILMIDKIGFEAFTFKKLSIEIESTEATVYRYFENKHRLLIYLISWYWSYIEYLIDYETHHLRDPNHRLIKTLEIVAKEKPSDFNFPEINEPALERIVIAESNKTFLTKQIDEINKEGVFMGYKSLCLKLASMIKEINPNFKYSESLASTVLEASNQQLFFAQHLPSLSSIRKSENYSHANFEFIKTLVLNTISYKG